MQYNITPIQAKITDTDLSNVLDVKVNQDTGTACMIVYGLLYKPDGHRGTIEVSDRFRLTGADYTSYSDSDDRMRFAADYVASHLTPTLTIL